ncbi:hypothetical protein CFP59_03554 [Streptomyces malaysiensis subsp. malaysiensis]|nr:hypothetical protein CFP59_03554 [Streptomyces sp. M56]
MYVPGRCDVLARVLGSSGRGTSQRWLGASRRGASLS